MQKKKQTVSGAEAFGIVIGFLLVFIVLIAIGAAVTLLVWNVCDLDKLVEINYWQALGINLLLGSAGYSTQASANSRRTNG